MTHTGVDELWGSRPALVELRPLSERDASRFAAAIVASERLHNPWVSYPDTPEGVRAYLRESTQLGHEVFGVWCLDGSAGELAGVVHLSRLSRRPYLSAEVGCAAFEGHEGRGVMTSAMKLVLRQAFVIVGLHRVWALVDPGNGSSKRMLEKSGFAFEGLARGVVERQGEWRDLEQWAALASRSPSCTHDSPEGR